MIYIYIHMIDMIDDIWQYKFVSWMFLFEFHRVIWHLTCDLMSWKTGRPHDFDMFLTSSHSKIVEGVPDEIPVAMMDQEQLRISKQNM